jgi:iron complex outermembrane receptor protein
VTRTFAAAAVAVGLTAIPSPGAQAQEVPPASVEHLPSPEQTEPQPVAITGRAGENAVRQAEDAFGYSVGRETLGLYSSSNVRGFSPFKAGNVRI